MNSQGTRARGFSLIELLIVIAIIGVITGAILPLLNAARFKGGDASIKANLTTVKNQASLYFDNNGNDYGSQGYEAEANNCILGMFSDETLQRAFFAARAQANDGAGGAYGFCHSYNTGWYAAMQLKSDPTSAWCVDSQGSAIVVPVTEFDSEKLACAE